MEIIWDIRRRFTIKAVFSFAVVFSAVASIHNAFSVAEAAAGCPHGCLCTTSDQVVCQNNGLEKVPVNLSTSTLQLSIKKTLVEEIPSQAFWSLKHLKRLILDNNKITRIARDAFLGLGNMEELSLQNNPLTTITPGAFSGLFNIRNLYLGYNKITEIQEKAFFGSENIRSLYLHGNPLKTIRTGAFQELKNVDSIFLPYQIRHMELRAFYGLSNVSSLEFQVLETKAILPSTFEGLSGVHHLSFRESQIGTIRRGAFKGLKNVKRLVIEGSNINTIETTAFSHMNGIEAFYIQFNKVANFHPGAFDGLLHNEAVKSIVVNQNLVPCDCRLHWFRDHDMVVPSIMKNNNCSEPDEYKGWSLDSVPLDGMGLCSPSESSFHSDDSPPPGFAVANCFPCSSLVFVAALMLVTISRRTAVEY